MAVSLVARRMVCAAAIALFCSVLAAGQQAAAGTLGVRPHASPVRRPAITRSVSDARTKKTKASVTYQFDTAHTGNAGGKLHLPVAVKWTTDLGAPVGYPVVAKHVVVVSAGNALVGLDEKTGTVKWSQGAPSGGSWVGPAYENGTVFSNLRFTGGSNSVGMYAFNIKTGKQVWSAVTIGQYAFSSPPTALNGTVYTGGAGSGGTVYAFNEQNGNLTWHSSVENGDDSSPVVTATDVYVSYACPQTYDFAAATGTQVWHFSGPCEGGGGSTAVLYNNLLYVEDSFAVSGFNGMVLGAANGTPTGANFNSNFPPAFSGSLGYFVAKSNTLVAANVSDLSSAWTASIGASDFYATPPLVVGKSVLIETGSGQLIAYDASSGQLQQQLNLGASDTNPGFAAGIGYGSKTLFVPAGNALVAVGGS